MFKKNKTSSMNLGNNFGNLAGDLSLGYSILRIIPSNTIDRDGISVGGGQNFASIATYYIPMPKGATDVYGNQWEASEFVTPGGLTAYGKLAAAGLQQTKAAMGVGFDIMQSLSMGIFANPTQEVANALSLGTKESINPYTQAVYKSPNLREFQFTWALIAKNKAMADMIKDIIAQCRENSYPQLGTGLLIYPNYFQIEVYGNSKRKLISTYASALVSMQVNYDTAGQIYIFDSGDPVTATITLGLQEIRLLDRVDIQGLYN